MGMIAGLLGNKISGTLIFMLMTWGVTSGMNWWSNYEERQQYEQAVQSYAYAFDQERQAREATDQLLQQSEFDRRKNQVVVNNTISQLFEAANNEESTTECSAYSDIIVPDAYIAVLRSAITQAKSNHNKLSTTAGIIDRLRGASSGRHTQ